ncbi:unnamed protein product [Mytilus coruscus]|uniref:CCHC-type domain-containing protein n=1 Tax=Mytilus coruscus TaxID=42192 RepID=A0A6J8CUK7_MYTCO|nr:unnamed protein product [Mytilus coruscus]
MSDIGDHTATNAHDRGGSQPPAPSSDIADAFHLFRDYLDYKLVDLKAGLASEQDNFSRKFKEEVGIKFKKEGNSIQYHFNDEILTGLHKIQKKGPSLDSPTNSIVSELITKVKARNKSIRIADSSAGGWTTVCEYESNTIADNSDDEKKIRQAESRAVKSIKERTKPRPSPYNISNRATQIARPAETVPNPAYSQPYSRYSQPPQPFRAGYGRREPAQYDMCHQYKQFGHWRKNCPLNRVQTFQHNAQGKGAPTILNRYLMISI